MFFFNQAFVFVLVLIEDYTRQDPDVLNCKKIQIGEMIL